MPNTFLLSKKIRTSIPSRNEMENLELGSFAGDDRLPCPCERTHDMIAHGWVESDSPLVQFLFGHSLGIALRSAFLDVAMLLSIPAREKFCEANFVDSFQREASLFDVRFILPRFDMTKRDG